MNSGRLSVPCTYEGSPLNSPDELPKGPARSRPGSSCPDAPLEEGFLLSHLGDGFVILGINAEVPESLEEEGITARGLTLHRGRQEWHSGGALSRRGGSRYLSDPP